MALEIGDITATTGLAGAIYDQIRENIEPDLADLTEEDREPIRDGWRKLAHGIATGVVNHLLANLEIRNIQTRGNVDNVTISGVTGSAPPANHTHSAGSLRGAQNNVTFNQSNEGTGLIA